MLWDYLSVPSSRVKLSKKNAWDIGVHSCIGNGVGGDGFQKSMVVASRVSEAMEDLGGGRSGSKLLGR
jgi:hypothetical protein